jgi:hypothetical protein
MTNYLLYSVDLSLKITSKSFCDLLIFFENPYLRRKYLPFILFCVGWKSPPPPQIVRISILQLLSQLTIWMEIRTTLPCTQIPVRDLLSTHHFSTHPFPARDFTELRYSCLLFKPKQTIAPVLNFSHKKTPVPALIRSCLLLFQSLPAETRPKRNTCSIILYHNRFRLQLVVWQVL